MFSVRPIVEALSPVALLRWTRQHFDRLAEELLAPQDALRLRTLHVEPAKYSEGDIVEADGADWNPGSGAGLYIRRGGAWVHLG